jgi:uncharacterized membrane protein HdeD (DUF308 family)
MAFWTTLIRGILAFGLGAALLLQPEKSLPMLANFMGIYWLVSGAVSLRWGAAGERPRPLTLAAGIVGVLAGLAMLARWFAVGEGGEALFATILGGIILLTGLLHVFAGFPTRQGRAQQGAQRSRGLPRARSWTSVLLGAFEVVLGVLLILSPLERRGPVFYGVVTIWALLGGLILLLDAARLRRSVSAKRSQQASVQDGQSLEEDQE